MRIAIMGDSFTLSYEKTWLELICKENNLEILHTVGFAGQSNYKIYENFKNVIMSNPDIILFVMTDYTRLFHPTEAITYSILTDENMFIKSEKIYNAAKLYYEHLYQNNFAKEIDRLLINEIQKICKLKKIKLIMIPAFFNGHYDKTYGLWILCNDGLTQCSKIDYKKYSGKEFNSIHDYRINHFSPNGHQILANNIIPHIKKYITTDQEFHISLIFPELFA
jgi:hypothetical protein